MNSLAARKRRVLIVEDSPTARDLLKHIIDADSRLMVVAAVATGEAALAVLDKLRPDVITMDVRLPGMNGLETTKQIMKRRPTPIVVVAADVESEDLKISINALKAGALSVVDKPTGQTGADFEGMAKRLCRQLVLMSEVRLVRQRRPYAPAVAEPAPRPPCRRVYPGDTGPSRYTLLGIVASTGGPVGLVEILSGLGGDFPLPILVVQHITGSFLVGFVRWLNESVPLTALVAEDGMVPRAGCIYVAPDDRHLILKGNCLKTTSAPMVCSQRPSGTVLFQSMAENVGSRAVALLLTGMGEDGAVGMHAVQEAGGHTIAEDESTAIVYGMPGAAVALGAVCESLPLPSIAPRLRQLVKLGAMAAS